MSCATRSFTSWISKPLRGHFGGRRLSQITANDAREYRIQRLQAGRAPETVNHEVGLLLRLLKHAKLRHLIGDELPPLAVAKKPRQMLTPAEKSRLFEVAASKPDWQTAFCVALPTANTTLRPVELCRLKWQDLDPINRELVVRESKTEAGIRSVPLNDEGWAAIAALKQRADWWGTYAPEHYIFPRLWPKVDPTLPTGRNPWRSLRAEAAKEDKERGREAMPRLTSFRFYDLRHQSITEILEAGVPEGVIREIAGHVDPAMTRHYSHPRRAARRAAVEALATVKTGGSQVGYATNHVTKALPAPSVTSQVVESNGRGARI